MAMRSHYLVQQFAERINETYLMFQQKLSWYRHLKNLMKSDLSWQSVAPQYIDVFREGIERYQKDGPAQSYGG
jgi:glycogen synthase